MKKSSSTRAACEDHLIKGKLNILEYKKNEGTSDMDLFHAIDDSLNHSAPAAIGIALAPLSRATHANPQQSGAHEVLLVGRRLKDGHCEYLIRNSWGANSCWRLTNDQDACKPAGHLWVRAEDLSSALKEVTVYGD